MAGSTTIGGSVIFMMHIKEMMPQICRLTKRHFDRTAILQAEAANYCRQSEAMCCKLDVFLDSLAVKLPCKMTITSAKLQNLICPDHSTGAVTRHPGQLVKKQAKMA